MVKPCTYYDVIHIVNLIYNYLYILLYDLRIFYIDLALLYILYYTYNNFEEIRGIVFQLYLTYMFYYNIMIISIILNYNVCNKCLERIGRDMLEFVLVLHLTNNNIKAMSVS